MNRGGLSGLVNEFDDRFTGHTAAALEALGADGGKMLTRICLGDPDTVAMLEATAKAIDSLAERKLIAMVEPFLSVRENGKVRNDLSTNAVIKSIAIAEGLGSTSAYTWMKLPVVAEMERVMAATTMPTVLLGGDPDGTQDEVFASWEAALALPGVQGLTVGRTLLYPPDGDVAGAVATAASLLNHTASAHRRSIGVTSHGDQNSNRNTPDDGGPGRRRIPFQAVHRRFRRRGGLPGTPDSGHVRHLRPRQRGRRRARP